MALARDDAERHVVETFPHVERIDDDELRAGTVEVWVRAMLDNEVDDLGDLQWYPPAQTEYDLGAVRSIDHVRDVTELAIAMAEQLSQSRDVEPSMDLVIAGALLHDCDKAYAFDGMELTRIQELIGHPYYGIHLVEAAGLPHEMAHIVLCHSPQTNVEPAFLEAKIITTADEVAADVLLAEDTTELRR